MGSSRFYDQDYDIILWGDPGYLMLKSIPDHHSDGVKWSPSLPPSFIPLSHHPPPSKQISTVTSQNFSVIEENLDLDFCWLTTSLIVSCSHRLAWNKLRMDLESILKVWVDLNQLMGWMFRKDFIATLDENSTNRHCITYWNLKTSFFTM